MLVLQSHFSVENNSFLSNNLENIYFANTESMNDSNDFEPVEIVKISNKTKTWGIGITIILLFSITIPLLISVYLLYKNNKGKNKIKDAK